MNANIEPWNVKAMVDSDGHLNLYITNTESRLVNEIETGQGDGDGEPFALRFTTPLIENNYAKGEYHESKTTA